MTNQIVPGRRFSGRPAPNTLVLSGRGRQRGKHPAPKAEPARPNSRRYDWGSPLPRPAWREDAPPETTHGPHIYRTAPVILIRGQDQAAIPAMRAWCEAHLVAGGDPAMVDLVEAHIRRVQEWQDHAYKVADLPVGTTGA